MAVDVTHDIQKGTGDVQKVIAEARKMMKLQLEIEQLESELAAKKAEHFLMATDAMPKIMNNEGVDDLGLANGYRLLLDSVFRANLPAEGTIEKAEGEEQEALQLRRDEGLEWLNDNGGGDIIKTQVKIDLGKGQEEFKAALLKEVKRLQASRAFAKTAKGIIIKEKEEVHPATLAKYLREKVEAGADVPLETFAIFNGQVAQIKAPTQGKKDKQHHGQSNPKEGSTRSQKADSTDKGKAASGTRTK